VLERKAPPTFEVIVEIQDWHHVTVHPDVAHTVDNLLLGRKVQVQVRQRDDHGEITMIGENLDREDEADDGDEGRGLVTIPRAAGAAGLQPLNIYPFGVSRPKLEQAIRDMRLPVTLVRDIEEADLLLTLKNYYRRKPPALRDAESHGKPVYVLKNNTMAQMQSCLAGVYDLDTPRAAVNGNHHGDPMLRALQEAEDAIGHAMDNGRSVDLPPQNAYVRRMQHRLAERYNLSSRSLGKEPHRHVRIFPGRTDGEM
jgi:hypothetical protein